MLFSRGKVRRQYFFTELLPQCQKEAQYEHVPKRKDSQESDSLRNHTQFHRLVLAKIMEKAIFTTSHAF